MGLPYRARVNERWLRTCPASTAAPTSSHISRTRASVAFSAQRLHDAERTKRPDKFEPRMFLEWPTATIGSRWSSTPTRMRGEKLAAQARHLLAALRVFREGLVEEFEPYTGAARVRGATPLGSR